MGYQAKKKQQQKEGHPPPPRNEKNHRYVQNLMLSRAGTCDGDECCDAGAAALTAAAVDAPVIELSEQLELAAAAAAASAGGGAGAGAGGEGPFRLLGPLPHHFPPAATAPLHALKMGLAANDGATATVATPGTSNGVNTGFGGIGGGENRGGCNDDGRNGDGGGNGIYGNNANAAADDHRAWMAAVAAAAGGGGDTGGGGPGGGGGNDLEDYFA